MKPWEGGELSLAQRAIKTRCVSLPRPSPKTHAGGKLVGCRESSRVGSWSWWGGGGGGGVGWGGGGVTREVTQCHSPYVGAVSGLLLLRGCGRCCVCRSDPSVTSQRCHGDTQPVVGYNRGSHPPTPYPTPRSAQPRPATPSSGLLR